MSWQAALGATAARMREIVAAHGPDAVAFYGSGELLTEEYYVAAKLAKGFLGTNNFDTNSRLCIASASVGYARSLGADGPPPTYGDLELADCFLLIGTNTADCHPIVWKRIKKRKLADPDGTFVIVADPRWTETADIADLHLPIGPVVSRRRSSRSPANPMRWPVGRPEASPICCPDTAPSRTKTARTSVERHWGVPSGRIAPRPGRSALEIFEGLASGEVRAVGSSAPTPRPPCPTWT